MMNAAATGFARAESQGLWPREHGPDKHSVQAGKTGERKHHQPETLT